MFSLCVAIVYIQEIACGINDVSTNRLKFANSLGIRLQFKCQPLKTSLSRYFLLLVRKIRKKSTELHITIYRYSCALIQDESQVIRN